MRPCRNLLVCWAVVVITLVCHGASTTQTQPTDPDPPTTITTTYNNTKGKESGTSRFFGNAFGSFGGSRPFSGPLNTPFGGSKPFNGPLNTPFGGSRPFGGPLTPPLGPVYPPPGPLSPYPPPAAAPVYPGNALPGYQGYPPFIPPPSQSCKYFCPWSTHKVPYCCDNSPSYTGYLCPDIRPTCPNSQRHLARPRHCSADWSCQMGEKCCFDTCARGHVCKTPK